VVIDAHCSTKGLFTEQKKRGKLPKVIHRKMIVSKPERGCEIDRSRHGSLYVHCSINSLQL